MPQGKLKPTSCYVCGQKIDPRGLRTHIRHKHPNVYLQPAQQPVNIEKKASLEELFAERDNYAEKLRATEILISEKLNELGLVYKSVAGLAEELYGKNEEEKNG